MPINLNLDNVKNDLRAYHDSGDYYNEITTKYNQAISIVKPYIGQNDKAIVIDLDETIITEYSLMIKYDFGWFDLDLEEAQYCVSFPAFQCATDFMTWCIKNGILVNILTSRRQKYQSFILQLLANAGVTCYTSLILRADDDHGTIQNYKIQQRQNLINNGLDIILNIGDQDSDLAGGYSDNDIKIPNPFYLITSDMVTAPFEKRR